MGVRIWDRGEFERLPEKRRLKPRIRLLCRVGGCPVMFEGKSPRKVLRAIRKHRAQAHPHLFG
jgi:hypothetical protein